MNAVTEEEARKKWCPMARHPDGNRVPYGGDGTEAAEGDKKQFSIEMADLHPCIASGCMMWRWRGGEEDQYETKEHTAMGVPPPGPGWETELADKGREGFVIKSRYRRKIPATGYCGLARSEHL